MILISVSCITIRKPTSLLLCVSEYCTDTYRYKGNNSSGHTVQSVSQSGNRDGQNRFSTSCASAPFLPYWIHNSRTERAMDLDTHIRRASALLEM